MRLAAVTPMAAVRGTIEAGEPHPGRRRLHSERGNYRTAGAGFQARRLYAQAPQSG
jgi:hypothetical protein